MKTLRVLAWAVPLSLVGATSHAAPVPIVTDYCLTEQVGASGDTAALLGKFVMKARLTITGSHYTLDAWNVMPDNPQTLEIHADGVYRPNAPTPIRFIDNYDNRGKGHFTATKTAFHLDIDTVTPSPGNIGRNYGAYDLTSRKCKWAAQ